MMDIPLSVSRILTYGSTVHANTKVTTWHGDGSGEATGENPAEETTFAEIAARAAAFAHALHEDLGVTGDERVGTLL